MEPFAYRLLIVIAIAVQLVHGQLGVFNNCGNCCTLNTAPVPYGVKYINATKQDAISSGTTYAYYCNQRQHDIRYITCNSHGQWQPPEPPFVCCDEALCGFGGTCSNNNNTCLCFPDKTGNKCDQPVATIIMQTACMALETRLGNISGSSAIKFYYGFHDDMSDDYSVEVVNYYLSIEHAAGTTFAFDCNNTGFVDFACSALGQWYPDPIETCGLGSKSKPAEITTKKAAAKGATTRKLTFTSKASTARRMRIRPSTTRRSSTSRVSQRTTKKVTTKSVATIGRAVQTLASSTPNEMTTGEAKNQTKSTNSEEGTTETPMTKPTSPKSVARPRYTYKVTSQMKAKRIRVRKSKLAAYNNTRNRRQAAGIEDLFDEVTADNWKPDPNSPVFQATKQIFIEQLIKTYEKAGLPVTESDLDITALEPLMGHIAAKYTATVKSDQQIDKAALSKQVGDVVQQLQQDGAFGDSFGSDSVSLEITDFVSSDGAKLRKISGFLLAGLCFALIM